MSKRRVFDIDFSDDTPAPAPEPTARRGPMASAISENAEALEARSSAEAAIRAENDRLAHEHVRLKKAGLIVDLVPLDQVHTGKLARDRKATGDDDIEELKASIRELGLSNPIQVEQVEDGFELIQGYRRLQAYRALYEETGEDQFASIPAGLSARGEALEKLYRRMVDENLVRKDISFGEMAALGWAYVRDGKIKLQNIDEAIDSLYASASRQKRSYIKHFAFLLRSLEGALDFIEAIPRALGLKLAKQLREHPQMIAQLKATLEARPGRDPTEELAILDAAANARPDEKTLPIRPAGTAKTSFKLQRPEGIARCIAANGKFELKLDRDFSALERHRLEAALDAFFESLDTP